MLDVQFDKFPYGFYNLEAFAVLESYANTVEEDLTLELSPQNGEVRVTVSIDGVDVGTFRIHTLDDASRIVQFVRRYLSWYSAE